MKKNPTLTLWKSIRGLFLALQLAATGCLVDQLEDRCYVNIAEPHQPGLHLRCDGRCTPIQSDAKNCGGCGIVCGFGSSCELGACVEHPKYYDGPATLRGVWGSDASHVWAVGDAGTIVAWNGHAWTAQPSGVTAQLDGIWGSDENNVWAVGENGLIIRWDGSSWQAQSSGTASQLHGIWGATGSDIWAVGQSGTIIKWDGTTWTPQISGTTQDLFATFGLTAQDVWAVGAQGTLLRFDGSSWSTLHSTQSGDNYTVWGADSNNVWIGGQDGLSKWNGSVITVEHPRPMRTIWGASLNNVWALDKNNWTLYWDGKTWQDYPVTDSTNASAMWGLDKYTVWAVGTKIYKWNSVQGFLYWHW